MCRLQEIYKSCCKGNSEEFRQIKGDGTPMRILGFVRSRGKTQHSAQKAIAKICSENYADSDGMEAICLETAKKKFWEDESKCLRLQKEDTATSELATCARIVRKNFAENAPIGRQFCDTHSDCLLNHCQARKMKKQSKINGEQKAKEAQEEVKRGKKIVRQEAEEKKRKD